MDGEDFVKFCSLLRKHKLYEGLSLTFSCAQKLKKNVLKSKIFSLQQDWLPKRPISHKNRNRTIRVSSLILLCKKYED